MDEDETSLLEGQRVLIFLQQSTTVWRGQPVHLTWGADQGVFDIQDGLVTQRTPPHRDAPLERPMPVDEAIALVTAGRP